MATACALRELEERRVSKAVTEEAAEVLKEVAENLGESVNKRSEILFHKLAERVSSDVEDKIEQLGLEISNGLLARESIPNERLEELERKLDQVQKGIEKKMDDARDSNNQHLKNIHDCIERIAEEERTCSTTKTTADAPSTTGNPEGAPSQTYAAILAATMQPKQKTAISRDDLRARQLYIDQGDNPLILKDMSEAAILDKANEAWQQTTNSNSTSTQI